jgi:hypothetical protein
MAKRTIKVDSWVKTADGTEGRVCYIDARSGEAEILPRDGDRLVLPVSELRLAVEARRPPITGMPDVRPRCPFCDKFLRPDVQEFRSDGRDRMVPMSDYRLPIVRREFRGWRGYRIAKGNTFDKFCTLSCAYGFASAAFLAGYRIKRG